MAYHTRKNGIANSAESNGDHGDRAKIQTIDRETDGLFGLASGNDLQERHVVLGQGVEVTPRSRDSDSQRACDLLLQLTNGRLLCRSKLRRREVRLLISELLVTSITAGRDGKDFWAGSSLLG